ncbi:MAG: D-aminoacyl-tRNA deacylase [Phycisphaerales bacterium JB064]
MRVVIQRVAKASVTLPREAHVSGSIGPGILAMIGLQRDDTEASLEWMADKLTLLRIFPDQNGKMNLSVLDIPNRAVLLVPNFTVGCEIGKGRRPSFDAAMPPDQAKVMFHALVEKIAARGAAVQTGVFGADMHVELCNDGPVTFVLESLSQSK